MNRANFYQSTGSLENFYFRFKSKLEKKINQEIEDTLLRVEVFFNGELEKDDPLLNEKEIFYLSDKSSNMAFPFRVHEGRLKLIATNELKLEMKISAMIKEIERGKE